MDVDWINAAAIKGEKYTCGYCGAYVAPNVGYLSRTTVKPVPAIFVCPNCSKPTYWERGLQVPGVAFGRPVANVPKEVNSLYEEARACMKVNGLTAAVLACRKLLMHVAVEQGAAVGKTFVEYVEHLATAGWLPPNGKGWVDLIRLKGNEANHEIRLMDRKDAEDLIHFSEMLLRFIYELPAKVSKTP
jgi:hypothetical protein